MKEPKLFSKGYKTNVFSEHLCNRIRTRLGLTTKELPNSLIKKTTIFLNTKIGDFILENPEGMQLLIGNQPHGVLAISKHMPKELREDKFAKYEEIEALDIPEWRKKIILKRYSTAINRRVKYESLKKEEKEFYVNPHSFFYCYRAMWFNKRNCKIKKASAYKFEPVPALRQKLEAKVASGFEYEELHFHNFFYKKLKAIL